MNLAEFARRGGRVSRVVFDSIDTPFGPYVAIQSVSGHVGVARNPVRVDTADVFHGCEAWPVATVSTELARSVGVIGYMVMESVF